jgi:hypothetical protein
MIGLEWCDDCNKLQFVKYRDLQFMALRIWQDIDQIYH